FSTRHMQSAAGAPSYHFGRAGETRMDWILRNIDWVLLISGIGTCSVVSMALAPHTAQRSFFGAIADGNVANLIARSWGTMVFAAGLMMVYAADHPEVRLPIVLYAIAGKG